LGTCILGMMYLALLFGVDSMYKGNNFCVRD